MKSRRSSPRAAVLLGLSLLACPAYGQSEPSLVPGSAEQTVGDARAAFRAGTAEARKANWSGALEAFNRSYSLHAHAVTSYNIAYCERAIGHFTRARAAFARALSESASNSEGSLPDELAVLAEQYRVEAERALVVVALEIPRGVRLAVDGRPLTEDRTASGDRQFVAGVSDPGGPEEAPEGAERLLIDPGNHLFVVSRVGAADAIVSAQFRAGERARLSLPLPALSELRLGAANRVPVRRVQKPDRSWSYALLGIGAAGVLTGGIAGVVALHKRGVLRNACGPDSSECPSNRAGDLQTLKRSADVSTVAFVAGVAAAGAGLTLLLVQRAPSSSASSAPGRSIRLSPTVAGAGIDVSTEF